MNCARLLYYLLWATFHRWSHLFYHCKARDVLKCIWLANIAWLILFRSNNLTAAVINVLKLVEITVRWEVLVTRWQTDVIFSFHLRSEIIRNTCDDWLTFIVAIVKLISLMFNRVLFLFRYVWIECSLFSFVLSWRTLAYLSLSLRVFAYRRRWLIWRTVHNFIFPDYWYLNILVLYVGNFLRCFSVFIHLNGLFVDH